MDSTVTNHQKVWEGWIETMGLYFIAMNIREAKQNVFLLYQGGFELRKIYDRNETYEETLALLNEHFQAK